MATVRIIADDVRKGDVLTLAGSIEVTVTVDPCTQRVYSGPRFGAEETIIDAASGETTLRVTLPANELIEVER
jgi:hypothetical protein